MKNKAQLKTACPLIANYQSFLLYMFQGDHGFSIFKGIETGEVSWSIPLRTRHNYLRLLILVTIFLVNLFSEFLINTEYLPLLSPLLLQMTVERSPLIGLNPFLSCWMPSSSFSVRTYALQSVMAKAGVRSTWYSWTLTCCLVAGSLCYSNIFEEARLLVWGQARKDASWREDH
jgi:hypothetical protein